uniref:Uncharacterized protein n=1 Tax=Corethron hystrix TaxID=216773 RepID=A0A7S1BN01_9STRA|mmetsp:Transcript_32177/g.74056  ORF Transcript_32177/g.74056 Transcript_32177/m.74056 type:complete len:150 (+) Transcript_32177:583-1032(+)
MSKEGKAISSESSVGRATSQTDSVEDEHSLPPLIIRPQEDPPIQQGASEGESELHQEEVETHNRSITSPPPPSLDTSLEENRQVIAVSASKGPAAFFNLARKFLVTDEYCDLSALETAIVSAVDAAHLLERSKLATIVRSVIFSVYFYQ